MINTGSPARAETRTRQSFGGGGNLRTTSYQTSGQAVGGGGASYATSGGMQRSVAATSRSGSPTRTGTSQYVRTGGGAT